PRACSAWRCSFRRPGEWQRGASSSCSSPCFPRTFTSRSTTCHSAAGPRASASGTGYACRSRRSSSPGPGGIRSGLLLSAQELSHLGMELLHGRLDRRRLLDLGGGEDVPYLEGDAQPFVDQVAHRLRGLLSGHIEILLRHGARAEELVGDRLPRRLLVG